MSQDFVGKFVGVVPPSAFSNLSYPKQLLLMFDALAIDLGQTGLSQDDKIVVKEAMPEIGFLVSSEMLTLLSGLLASNEQVPNKTSIEHARRTLGRNQVTPERFNASLLRKKGVDAVPIMGPFENLDVDHSADRDSVIRLTLRQFPVPSNVTPWEAISEFRDDKQARDSFWTLKNWMNRVSKNGVTQIEIMDELRGLLSDYRKSMDLHAMKSNTGTFEVVVTTTTTVLEDIVKFKWSDAVKAVFQVHKQDVKLLEDEKNLPGKEVAYIANAIDRFT